MDRVLLALTALLLLAGCDSRRQGGTIRRFDTGIHLPDGGDDPLDGSIRPSVDAANPRDGSVPPDSGPHDSGSMFCPVLGPEDTVASCLDGCDNDQNGFSDCNDLACCSVASCPPNTACGRLPQACTERLPENTLARCSNGCDDDPEEGEIFADCGDRSCCLVREAGGAACGTGTYCADQFVPRTQLCPGDDVTQEAQREATLSACSNACDDDRNGFDDCSDRSCCAIRIAGGSACPIGTYCADMWTPGEAVLCPGDDVTQPPATETDALSCGDGCDNDRNGFQDCNDRNCCAARADCPSGTFCNP